MAKLTKTPFILFLLLAVSSLFNEARAQGDRIKMGFEISPGFSWLPVEGGNTDTKSRFSIGYGVAVDYLLNDDGNYALGTGIIYRHTGGKINYAVDTLNANIDLKLQYLEIPLSLKLKTNEFGYFTYFGQIGFTPMFRTRSKYNASVNDVSIAENESGKDLTNFFNVSLLVSGGIEYSLAEDTRLFGALFFHNGFVNIVEDRAELVGDGTFGRVNLSSFGLRVGLFF